MSFTTWGLPNGGRTARVQIEYDESSSLDGRDCATALLNTCDEDYELTSRWFRGVEIAIAPVNVRLCTCAPDADVAPADVTIVRAPGARPGRIRFLFVAELSKLFMRAQAGGWLDAEGNGHGLSLARFLGAQALACNALGAPELDLQPANAWMAGAREDYVNEPGVGEAADGCRVLFLYYLMMQLKFSVDQIVGAGAPDLAGVYRNLTGEPDDPFPHFKELLDGRYPGARTIPDGHPDNPWPIGHLVEEVVDEDEIPTIPWGRSGFIRP
ncbi:MAG TPA: hypothetical protein VIM18_08460 [Solirubrobacteraceae bacterium]|jgi:hypothetical protein